MSESEYLVEAPPVAIPTTMRAARVHEPGDPGALQVELAPTPQAGAGEVLLRVVATSVNPIDLGVRSGRIEGLLPFPAVLGWDVSGVVAAVGPEAGGRLSVGQRVLASPDPTRDGTYAEYVVVDEELPTPLPEGVDVVPAAGLPLAGMTAWQALFDHGRLTEGEHVLVHGGAGGVGHLAIQLAAHAGARVVATGSTTAGELVAELGVVDRFVDYTSSDVPEEVGRVDLVFDTVGGEVTDASLDLLGEGGRLVTIAGQPDEARARARGVDAGFFSMTPDRDDLARLTDLLASGDLRVHVAERFDLEDIAEAHRRMEAGHVHGKLIVGLL